MEVDHNQGSINSDQRCLWAAAYRLEMVLQCAGDVIAEVGSKGLQAVEEQHHEAEGGWKPRRGGRARGSSH